MSVPDHSANASRPTPNRLSSQSSPYLLQHAHNPVDWWAWGPEAIEEARRRDVPILLSVGYSTCYWCHVMERESFEDDSIARVMNERFVCVKLDREERPDLDDIYMTALLMLRGSGGWPMNVFLDPRSFRPFWAGTYFPPTPRGNMPGWPQVLESVSDAWRSRRSEVLEQAGRIAQAVGEHLSAGVAPVPIGETQVTDAVSQLLRSFDRVDGGFGPAPKFPQPSVLEFLMDVREIASDEPTREAIDSAVRGTLDAMACGGIFDHLGGGFHRYSVDARWTVPHFEKMLYDNAQLLALYARAAALYRDDFYVRAARRTAEYVLREMTGPGGEFYSAQDAEVGGREGLNYIWTADQVRDVLTPDDAKFVCDIYGLTAGPNFQDPHHPDSPPASVLRLRGRPDAVAATQGISERDLLARIDRVSAALLAVRCKRDQPRLDDKAITAWNGLMIGALAIAGEHLRESAWIQAADRAARFVRGTLWREGTLSRSWRDGVHGPPAVLEDYALLLWGLARLDSASRAVSFAGASGSGTAERKAWIDEVAREIESGFSDRSGRFFDTRADSADLFVRAGSTNDGAMPSAASVMLHYLLDEHAVRRDADSLEKAMTALAAMSSTIASSPVGCINATRALCRVLCDPELRATADLAASASERSNAPNDSASAVGEREDRAFEVYANVDRVVVGPDRPASLTLVVRIADGYHLVAAEPRPAQSAAPPQLTAARVFIGGGTGVRAYADYPAGERFEFPGMTPVMIYRGTIEFEIALEADGEWSGRPMLRLSAQACNDMECLRPRTVELDVAIDRA